MCMVVIVPARFTCARLSLHHANAIVCACAYMFVCACAYIFVYACVSQYSLVDASQFVKHLKSILE